MRGFTYTSVFLSLLLLTGCVSQAKYQELEKSFADRGEKYAVLVKKNEKLTESSDYLKLQLRAKEVLLRKREMELAQVREWKVQADQGIRKSLQAQLKAELDALRKGGADFQINKKTGGIILEDSVFFEKGSATLKPAAKNLLMKLARVLQSKDGVIQVNGHTDSDPVRKHARTWPHGNIQLSGARAMQVLIFLRDEGGLPASRMSFAGFGPHQPIAPNTTEASKRKNRRVEILLKSEGES